MADEIGGAVVASTSPTPRRSTPPSTPRSSALGGLTTVFNNAGVGSLKPLHKYTDKEWDLLVDVNLKGTFNGMRAAIPHLRDVRAAAASSTWRRSAGPPDPGRGPVRGGQGRRHRPDHERRARVRARRRAGQLRLAGLHPHPAHRLRLRHPGLHRAARAATPLGRAGTADDVADVVVFLASDLARYVTGQTWWSTAAACCPAPRSITCSATCSAKAERTDVT